MRGRKSRSGSCDWRRTVRSTCYPIAEQQNRNTGVTTRSEREWDFFALTSQADYALL